MWTGEVTLVECGWQDQEVLQSFHLLKALLEEV